MDAGIFDGVLAAGNTQEAGALLEGFRAQLGHFFQGCPGGESTVFLPVGHDVFGHRGVDTGNVGEQGGAGGVYVHAHGVHAILHHAGECFVQLGFLQVVLILSHADGLRVNLYQLSQRVLEPTGNGDRRAQVHIKGGEFLRRQFRRGVYRRACFADHHVAQGGAQVHLPHNLHKELLGFPAGRAVSDGHNGYAMLANQRFQLRLGYRGFLLGFGQVDHRGIQHAAGLVHHRNLAAHAVAGVQAHGHLALDGRLHEQRLEVQGKHMYGGLLSLVRQIIAQLRIQGRRDKPGIGVLTGGHHVLGGDAACMGYIFLLDDALHLRFIHGQLHLQKAFLLAAVHGQHTMRGHQPQRLVIIVIHAVDAVLLAGGLGLHQAGLVVQAFELGADARVVADALSKNVHGALQGILGGIHPLLRVQKALGELLGGLRLGELKQQRVRQGFQPFFFGDHGPGAALGLIGTVDILQLAHGGGIVQGSLQLLGPLLQLFQGGGDFLPAGLQVTQRGQTLAELSQHRIIQGAVGFLAVTGDKGQGVSLVQQGNHRLHLPGGQLELLT